MREPRRNPDPRSSAAYPQAPTPHPPERPIGLPWLTYLKALGPGLIAGLGDNDPSGVATYAIAGAVAGYRLLWLLFLSTFMVQAVQVTSAKLGDVTQQGVLSLTRQRYGWTSAALAGLVVVIVNEASMIADTAALGASFQLLTGLPWQRFIVPVIVLLLVTTVFFNFQKLETLFVVLGSLLLAYILTAFLVGPNWPMALHATVVPVLPRGMTEIAVAVALLGTTINPYLLVWQAEGEREVHRTRRQFPLAVFDVTVGYVFSNLISYFIIVTTAATLYVHHQSIQTASDAASALQPLAGHLASTVFALGILGTGILAVPVFAISTSYVVTELFGWPAGLSKSVREASRFYAVLTLSFLSGGVAVLLGVDPIVALFDSQVLDGLLMPILIVCIFLLANDPGLMGADRNSPYYNTWLILTFVVMAVGAVMLLAGLI